MKTIILILLFLTTLNISFSSGSIDCQKEYEASEYNAINLLMCKAKKESCNMKPEINGHALKDVYGNFDGIWFLAQLNFKSDNTAECANICQNMKAILDSINPEVSLPYKPTPGDRNLATPGSESFSTSVFSQMSLVDNRTFINQQGPHLPDYLRINCQKQDFSEAHRVAMKKSKKKPIAKKVALR